MDTKTYYTVYLYQSLTPKGNNNSTKAPYGFLLCEGRQGKKRIEGGKNLFQENRELCSTLANILFQLKRRNPTCEFLFFNENPFEKEQVGIELEKIPDKNLFNLLVRRIENALEEKKYELEENEYTLYLFQSIPLGVSPLISGSSVTPFLGYVLCQKYKEELIRVTEKEIDKSLMSLLPKITPVLLEIKQDKPEASFTYGNGYPFQAEMKEINVRYEALEEKEFSNAVATISKILTVQLDNLRKKAS
ncbi:hypothetical protein H6501_04780 [Candidatus Woesearchaeota archaeon]|nr:hypothetical protein [Nanoarchaeota archaeon]MCB9370888.1 hypothetical protein [Candidatus Woesearchaeota archaeon]USN43989.1 MAG: hypothetical protein H6500_06385 [Candidatus Woesearchaeota archaeon]